MDRRFDLLAIGRALLDLYARETGVPFAAVRTFAAYVGGCAANISVGAMRLGLRAALLTAVGDDPVGGFVLDFLRRDGVDVSSSPVKPGRRTSTVVAAVESPERPALVAYRDNCADLDLTVDDVRAAPLAESRTLLITGTGLSRDPSRSATVFAAERARTGGARVFLDLDYRDEYWDGVGLFREAVQAALPLSHVVVGTREEVAAALGGDRPGASFDDLEALGGRVEPLLAAGPEALVVKRGKESTFVFLRDGAAHEVATFPIEVVNPLGAGDAFAAGLIYARLHDWPWLRAVRFANACGAIVAGRHGCANAMPALRELRGFGGDSGD